MPNIKFSYLYRDSGNYKKFGAVVFDNPDNVNINELDLFIRSNLTDGTWFYADQWKIPDLYFDNWSNELDHAFHEFEFVAYTPDCANQWLSLNSFIRLIKCFPTT